MIQPFKLVKHKLILDPANISAPAYMAIFERDRKRGKPQAEMELLYVWHMCSFTSVYNNMAESERSAAIKHAYKLPEDFAKDDELVNDAMELFKATSYTTTMKMYESVKNMYERIAKQIDNMDVTAEDGNGRPKYTIKDVFEAVNQLAKAKTSLDELYEKIMSEINQEAVQIRGSVRKSSTFEDY